jgi:hypothetical protein
MKLAVVPLGLLCLAASAAHAADAPPTFYELRVYTAAQGKLDALLARFRDHTLKLFAKHGMTNIGYWTPIDPKQGAADTLVYLLGYPSAEAREQSWKAFAADPDWKSAQKASEVDGKLVAKVVSIHLAPTDYSMFNFASAASPRLFELRTYTTFEGKLPNLHDRFRNHTVKLFEKHGMTNVLYTTPTRDKDAKDRTLIYFLAHQDAARRDASFAAFRVDPQWIKVKNESEKDGSLTVKENGVVSLLLAPTDFSPLK